MINSKPSPPPTNPSTSLKYKKFSYYQQKYYRKLRQPNCVIQPLNQLCGGCTYSPIFSGFLQTFKQVINKLSTNKTSPLPLFFPNDQSMQLITKNKVLREQIFNAFDTRAIKRIDACQLYCALIVISKGSFQVFLKTVVDVFGFQYPGRILRDQFFFFLDCFFRAVPKIVIVKNFNKPSQPNIRLQFQQLNSFVSAVFGSKQQIQRNQIYEYIFPYIERSLIRHQGLNQFIRHIQKKCNGSAERCRNETIQRVGIETEVRIWLMEHIANIEAKLEEQRNHLFAQVLN